MKERKQDTWGISPGMPGEVWLHRETIVTKDGLGAKPSIYPVTIVQARHNGSYEGAPWLCFPLHVRRLADPTLRDWDGDEIECARFWRLARDREWLIGLGSTPMAAYDNLIDQACARAGVDRADLTEEPT
jgi:hypothetical protein